MPVHRLYNMAATADLLYGGFALTTGRCTFCGKVPDSTSCLYQLTNATTRETFEIGPMCFRDFKDVLRRDLIRATDPTRKKQLEGNLDRMCRTVYARDTD